MNHTHLTAPTRHIEADGAAFAYRRWGNSAMDQPPLFFLQHFRGGMDHWDPLMTDGLAAGREVILYNGRGLASSTGTPRNRIEDMADDAAAVIRALGLTKVDVLGFSLGGFVALDLTWRHPELVRKLMLLGTGPRGRQPRVGTARADHRGQPGAHPGRLRVPVLRPLRPGPTGRRRRSGSAVTSGWTRTHRVPWRCCKPRSKPTCCTCPG